MLRILMGGSRHAAPGSVGSREPLPIEIAFSAACLNRRAQELSGLSIDRDGIKPFGGKPRRVSNAPSDLQGHRSLTQDAIPRPAGTSKRSPDESYPAPYLAPFSSTRVAVGLGLSTLFLLIVFNRIPAIDLTIAGWFFTERPCPEGHSRAICGGFLAMNDPRLMMVREVLHYLPVSIAIALLLAAIPAAFAAKSRQRLFARGAMTAVAAMLISPLLIVNGLLKEFFGRPRPIHTDLFAGELPFVEAGRFTDYCDSNCSFVSGEASTGFWLICLVPLFPARFRPLAWVVMLSLAVSTSGLRIAFGGHYFSDVVLGAAITLTVFSLLAALARTRRLYEV